MATVVGYAGLTGLAIGYAPTRQLGFRMGSFGIRAAGNVTFGATRGLLGTSLVRGGSATLGGTVAVGASAITLGYAIGAIGGTIIAQTVWGDEGAKDALYFYSNPIRAIKEM